MLTRIDGVLLGRLDPDLRAFLQEARIILGRSVARCDDAIAGLDREREVRREPDQQELRYFTNLGADPDVRTDREL